MPEKRHMMLSALVVANRGLSACWLFRQDDIAELIMRRYYSAPGPLAQW